MVMMIDEHYHQKSDLESLPPDVLIRIICGVDHEDLKQLHNVSKSIREATRIAKQLHFAYSTPTKVKAFRTCINLEEASEINDIGAPNVHRQWWCIKKRKMRIDESEDELEPRKSIRKKLQLIEREEK